MTLSVREAAIELLFDYAERIDEDRLEEWLELFTEDASYRVLPRENQELNLPVSLILCTNKAMIRDRVVALRTANEYNLHYDRHLVTNIRARETGDTTISISANFSVMQTNLEGETRLFSVGRYAANARQEQGRLLLSEMLVVIDTFAVPTLLATPL
jgi:anthranilate 1,2-dioxygenase small subunit